MYSLEMTEVFLELFDGNKGYHGEFIPGELNKTTNKQEGSYSTKQGSITNDLILSHFKGEIGIGIIPINDEDCCKFSVIDVDNYNQTQMNLLIDTIYHNNLPLLPFKSKSGGLHIYIFWDEAVKAEIAIKYTKQFVMLLGLNKNTEVFPKQKKKGKSGSFINLPYFNGDGDRYLYDDNKQPTSLYVALSVIEESKTNTEKLDEIIAGIPLADAPPCLQSLYLRADTTFRNNYLFSMAVYYKSKYGDDFEEYVVKVNSKLDSPLKIDELKRSVISSNVNNSYMYKCNDAPLLDACWKTECKKREFGIDSSNISQLTFESMTQYTTDPPHYCWVVNGKPLYFYKESDIINQKTFRDLCMRELHILPSRLTDYKWTNIVNTALSNLKIQEVDASDDISPGMMLKEYLVEFFEHDSKAKNKEQILMDKVYKDVDKKVYIFKPKILLNYLITSKNFRVFGAVELQVKLTKMGGMATRYYINKDCGSIRAWQLPIKALKKFVPSDRMPTINFEPEDIYEDEQY